MKRDDFKASYRNEPHKKIYVSQNSVPVTDYWRTKVEVISWNANIGKAAGRRRVKTFKKLNQKDKNNCNKNTRKI